MKNKIILGQKTTRKSIFITYLELSLIALLLGVGIFNILRLYTSITFYWQLSIILFIFTLILLTPVIVSGETMEFNDQQVNYYHVDGYFQKFYEVFRIIIGKNEIPNISMKTSHIDQLALSYLPFFAGNGLKGYKLKLTFLLKDGTLFTIYPATYDQMKNGDYERIFQLLEKNNIIIHDKYHLRQSLSISADAYYQHIKSIEDGKKNA